jgi:ubiquitin C
MQIFVKTTTNKVITLDVETNSTVADAKEQITKKEDIPIEYQRFAYKGKLLDNNIKLCDYGITKDDTLALILCLRGG